MAAKITYSEPMKRFALLTALVVLVVPAASHSRATKKVSLKEGERVLTRYAQSEAERMGASEYAVDSCSREARGYEVRCRLTWTFVLADDGKNLCSDFAFVTQERKRYDVRRQGDFRCRTERDDRTPPS